MSRIQGMGLPTQVPPVRVDDENHRRLNSLTQHVESSDLPMTDAVVEWAKQNGVSAQQLRSLVQAVGDLYAMSPKPKQAWSTQPLSEKMTIQEFQKNISDAAARL